MSCRSFSAYLLLGVLLATQAWGQQLSALSSVAPACRVPTPDIDPRRSLFVTEEEVVSQAFSLEEVLAQLARDSGVPGLGARDLWRQWWDTQNPGPGLGLGLHCDDHAARPDDATLNGFPIQCPRNEGGEIHVNPFDPEAQSFYKPLALVNRFDLAPADGANCGEYRVIFGRESGVTDIFNRNLIIFEAVLPNPRPGCGIEGCREVARFWERLSRVDDPARRARMLRAFYLKGFPRHDIEPVIRLAHFAPGSGQIRTNQFLSGPEPQIWQLRDFKLALLCTANQGPCRLLFAPVSVKTNPFGELFSENFADPRTFPFMRHMLTQVGNLSEPDLNGFFNVIPERFNAGQSNAQGSENHYPVHFANSPRFEQALQARLDAQGSSLEPIDLMRRSMAQSCAGCHELSNGFPENQLGDRLEWPPSLGFTHVDEGPPVSVGGIPHFEISRALEEVFLPHREKVFERYLAKLPCVACSSPALLADSGDDSSITVPLAPDGLTPALISSEEVFRIDAERRQGAKTETLGGSRSVH